MVLGDGIRRNIASVSKEERDRLRDAFITLDNENDPRVVYPDGVTFWDKQEEIHKNAHAGGLDIHDGPAFLPWHRELINRLEELIRKVDDKLSLHYWDWTTDPRSSPDGKGNMVNLFTREFLGNANGNAGDPFSNFESSEGAETGNGHDYIWRNINNGVLGAPPVNFIPLDKTIVTFADEKPENMQFQIFNGILQDAHNYAHGYIGGTLTDSHYSFHDPCVFLLHSNVDRIFALWQTNPKYKWRLNPNRVYGIESKSGSLQDDVNPWAGTLIPRLRPWAPPDNLQDNPPKKYTDTSIVIPHSYDTNGSIIT